MALNAGELTPEDAAMAKWWCTELQGRVVDRCLQLFGGYGYMLEYPIARAFADARVTRIYGGANEIMKEIVGRSLGPVGAVRVGCRAMAGAELYLFTSGTLGLGGSRCRCRST